MKNIKKLYGYRILEESGNWFYYFVITIIVYNLDNSSWSLGILALSYTLPGIIFSPIFAKSFQSKNIKNILIIQTIFRAISLMGILIFRNIILILTLVFVEQICAIGSNLCFQQLIIENLISKKSLKKYNKNVNTLVNLIRLLVVPIYLILKKTMPINYFMLIDILCEVFSALLIINLNYNKKVTVSNTTTQKAEIFKGIPKEIAVPLFSVVIISLIIAFNTAYSISYIGLIVKNTNVWYAWLTFFLAVADLVGSYISKKIIDIFEAKIHNFKIIIYMIICMGILIIFLSIFYNIIYFIIVCTLLELIYVVLQLYALYRYQICNQVIKYTAIQNIGVDGIAFINSMFGAYIISAINLSVYLIIIGLTVILSALLFEFYKVKRVKKWF